MRCACCGYEIKGDGHKLYGMDRYVCERCWSNPVLFFTNKFSKFPIVSERFNKGSRDPYGEVICMTLEKRIEKYEMSVAGETIKASLEWIPLGKITLDPNNVRFKHIARELNDKEIEDKIWAEYDTQDLLKDIKFAHGLREKPVLYHDYRVCEGNRRIVCLRKLVERIKGGKVKDVELKEIDPVLCIVLPEDVDISLVAMYLAGIHVTGKLEWDTLNKAAHIYDLVHAYEYSVDDLTKALQMSKKTIYDHIRAYELTTQYGKKYADEEGDTWLLRFSHFLELIKKKGIKDWLEDPKNIETFMEWIHKGKVGRAENVRKLVKIVQGRAEHPDAYKALFNGVTVDEAFQLMERSEQVEAFSLIVGSFDEDLDRWISIVKDFPKSKIVEIANDPVRYLRLATLNKELEELINIMRAMKKE